MTILCVLFPLRVLLFLMLSYVFAVSQIWFKYLPCITEHVPNIYQLFVTFHAVLKHLPDFMFGVSRDASRGTIPLMFKDMCKTSYKFSRFAQWAGAIDRLLELQVELAWVLNHNVIETLFSDDHKSAHV